MLLLPIVFINKLMKSRRQIIQAFKRRLPSGGTIHIEDIQDQVELALMRSGQYKVARAYVLYREEHRKARQTKVKQQATDSQSSVNHYA